MEIRNRENQPLPILGGASRKEKCELDLSGDCVTIRVS